MAWRKSGSAPADGSAKAGGVPAGSGVCRSCWRLASCSSCCCDGPSASVSVGDEANVDVSASASEADGEDGRERPAKGPSCTAKGGGNTSSPKPSSERSSVRSNGLRPTPTSTPAVMPAAIADVEVAVMAAVPGTPVVPVVPATPVLGLMPGPATRPLRSLLIHTSPPTAASFRRDTCTQIKHQNRRFDYIDYLIVEVL